MIVGDAARSFAWVVFGLAALFTTLDAQPARGLGLLVAGPFWLATVAIGLLLAVLAVKMLNAWLPTRRLPAMVTLVLAGLIGLAAFAPVSIAFDAWLLPPTAAEPPDDWLDDWESAGGLRQVAAEALQAAPAFLLSWLLLNLRPLRLSRRSASAPPSPPPPPQTTGEAETAPVDEDGLLQRLPPALGTDLIAVSADLHYLQVHTTVGRAMLLGNLGAVDAEMGERGLRIHRSHWVACAQVRRIVPDDGGWACEMNGGLRLPISRRRLSAVRARLGSDFVRDPISAPPAAPQ